MNIRVEDLIGKCSKCNGHGIIEEFRRTGLSTVASREQCTECNRGMVLTDSGKAIYAFFQQLRAKGMI